MMTASPLPRRRPPVRRRRPAGPKKHPSRSQSPAASRAERRWKPGGCRDAWRRSYRGPDGEPYAAWHGDGAGPRLLDLVPTRQRTQRETSHPYYTEAVIEAWLTQGARINHEVNFHRLGNTMKKKFDQAMKKEWLSWLDFNAVEVIDPADLPVKVNLVGSR